MYTTNKQAIGSATTPNTNRADSQILQNVKYTACSVINPLSPQAQTVLVMGSCTTTITNGGLALIQPDIVLPSPPKATQGRLSVSVSISNTRCQEKPRLKLYLPTVECIQPGDGDLKMVARFRAMVIWKQNFEILNILFQKEIQGGGVKGLTMAGCVTCLTNPRRIGLFALKFS